MDELEDDKSVDDDEVSPAPGPSVSGSQKIKIHSPIAKYVIWFIGISGLFMACHWASFAQTVCLPHHCQPHVSLVGPVWHFERGSLGPPLCQYARS